MATRIRTGNTVQAISSAVLCVVRERLRIAALVEPHHDVDEEREHEKRDQRDDDGDIGVERR